MIELRPRQVECLAELRQNFAKGIRTQVLYAPTGAGKTEVAIAMMEASHAKGKRSAMLLDRIVLCNQTSERLDRYSIPHGVLQSGHWRHRPDERIQVCSAQTIEKRDSFPQLDLLIVDEAHCTRKQTAAFIANRPDVKVVGLSASPFTKGLGNIYESIVSTMTTENLVDEKWLSPLKVFVAQEIDMTGAKKIAGEWSEKDVTERGVRISGDIVAEWVKKTHDIYGEPRKTIVFCAGVAHGEDLSNRFREAGYNFVSISYRDDDEYKAEVMHEFSKPDTDINGLIATDILTKGFDQPDVMIGISARPFSKSLSSHVQQMGRIMRVHEGKKYGTWICHSGNYLRFRDAWDSIYTDGVHQLDQHSDKAQRELTEHEKKDAQCPKCHHLWPKGSDTCPNCGHVMVRRNAVVEVSAEILELDMMKSAPKDAKQLWYSQLLYYCRSKGYKDGWCANKYREKFGVWPRGLSETAIPPSHEVLGFITHSAIKWARRRAA